jgi:hypothetical protein
VVPPVVVYQSAVRDGDRVFTSGQLPRKDGQLMTPGKLGGAVSEEEGYAAEWQGALNALAATRNRSVRSRPSSASPTRGLDASVTDRQIEDPVSASRN